MKEGKKMKKIVINIIILLVAISIFKVSYAQSEPSEPNIPLSFTGETTITQDTQKVTYTLTLGEFSGVPENAIMGYEAILDYDKNFFSEVVVEGTEDWSAQYTASTGRLIGETKTKAEPNKTMLKITLTLKQNVEPGTAYIKLKEGLLTVNDEDRLDVNFSKESTITIEKKKEEQEEKEEPNGTNQKQENETSNESNNGSNSNNNNNNNKGNSVLTTNTGKNQNKDNTATTKKLPKTGIGTIAILLSMVSIAGIGSFIKYKSIETK